MRPMRKSGIASCEPMLVIGMMALRSLMGKYPCACCTAWPASCAATPTAAAVALPYTDSDRRMTLVRGS